MRILITGGGGFIGGHTAEYHLRRGDDVIVIDNFNDYYHPYVKYQTIRLLRSIEKNENKAGRLHVYDVDITHYANMNEVFQIHKPHVICHLAAQAGVLNSVENPLFNVDSNVKGTVCILELCHVHNINRVVIASSSSVYGRESSLPFTENDRCETPMSPYGACKRACELLAYAYHHLYRINITVLRFFTVYGPRCRPDMACLKFIQCIHTHTHLVVYGDGSARRGYTYVSDAVCGIASAIDRSDRHPYLIVNIGGATSHTVSELIECIQNSMGVAANKI
eukprot:GHVR01132802.1.p1 GENE.GHVR01132802.1~~GHVR01132802.1.p1  ORF type:complete len:290 (+),score=73.24 GHVR01132802.1:35-871(+)